MSQRLNTVKVWFSSLALVLLLTGCATSTIETRKQERAAAYAALSSEWKELVDQGSIKVGMPADAVYIAWGPPAQVLTSETDRGAVTTWLYQGEWLESTRYWGYREVHRGNHKFLERHLETDYYPREYVSAEIVFVDDKVKSWRMLPRPVY